VGNGQTSNGIFYKIAAGGDGDQTASWVSTAVMAACTVAVYTGVDTTTPFLAEVGAGDATTGQTVQGPSLSNTNSAATAVAMFAANCSVVGSETWTAGANMTLRQQADSVQSGMSAHASLCWTDRANAPTGSQSYTASYNLSAVTHKAAWLGFLSPASVPLSGTTDTTLPHFTAQFAASQTDPGTLSATLPSMSAQLAGAAYNGATVAATLPHFGAQFTATQTDAGTTDTTLPHFTAQFAGSAYSGATLDATLPSLSAQFAGAVYDAVSLGATLPSFAAQLAVTQDDPSAFVSTLPSMSGAFVVVSRNDAALGGALPSLQLAAIAASLNSSSVTLDMPSMGATFDAEATNEADIVYTLPSMSADVSGGLNLTPVYADLAVTCPAFGALMRGRNGDSAIAFAIARALIIASEQRATVVRPDARTYEIAKDDRTLRS
jgi:hypothetical protein